MILIIYNNLIWDNGDQAISLYSTTGGSVTAKIYNNSTYLNGTLGDNSWFAELYIQENIASLDIRNNIFYAGAGDYTISAVAQSNMTCDYNIHYGPSGNPFYYNGTERNWSYWTNTLGKDIHGYNSNPLYVNPSADMSIQSTSPAINAGTNVGLTQDFDGNPVPQGPAPDIGAYEYQGAAQPDTTPPAPPTGVTVN